MKSKIFSVFDSKAKTFGLPFFQPNVELAVRGVTKLVNDQAQLIHEFPDDFILYEIGMYDDETGCITPLEPLKLIAPCKAYIRSEVHS